MDENPYRAPQGTNKRLLVKRRRQFRTVLAWIVALTPLWLPIVAAVGFFAVFFFLKRYLPMLLAA